ncbi:hypothetical protein BSNT_06493 [Bacillus subtilis subsp. natto BEST195]|nr:hypothetical protein BSNT_06493 [Bacillus subtilis subsp. natto BEST195]
MFLIESESSIMGWILLEENKDQFTDKLDNF